MLQAEPCHGVSGRLASSTKVVPSAPLSYDAELAGALWDLSADLAKLPR